MEKLLINTPQNVNIEYRLASLGERMIAIGIDYIIIITYVYLSILLLSAFNFLEGDLWDSMGLISLILLPAFFYPLYMEILFHGQTVGKIITKTKVVKVDGTRATSYEYFIRWTLSIVDVWLFSGMVGLVSIIATKKSQRVGDIAANTTVINLKANTHINQTILEQLSENYVVKYQNVIKFSDRDVNIIKNSYLEAIKNNNFTLLDKLTKKITEITGHEPENENQKDFIDRILKDHFHLHKNKV